MRTALTKYTCIASAAVPWICMFGQAVAQQEVVIDQDAPLFDRWMYPFNATPGERVAGPTFTAFGSGYDDFDDRDGQVLLGFETQLDVPSGLGAGSYQVVSGRLTVMFVGNGVIYDPTLDSWETWLEDGPADEDPGRPSIVSAAGFRNGFDGWSYGETGPFGAFQRFGRNAFPIDFAEDGSVVDISNNITDAFDPKPLGVASTTEVAVGDAIPDLTPMVFEFDVLDPDMQCYLRTALDAGLLSLVLTSHHGGSQDGSGSYPGWILKENSLVFAGFADAPGLELEVIVAEPSGVPGDIDGDGSVNVTDLLQVLNEWGCTCCITDINGDGRTDVTDLLAVISNWGG